MLFETNSLNNCLNSRHNSATASCQKSTLPTPSSVIMTQRQYYNNLQEEQPHCMTAEHIRELESIGFVWEKNSLNNCVNSRRNSATASCQACTLPTPSSRSGLRISATATRICRKESHIALQRSVFESSRALDSSGRDILLVTNGLNNCVNSRRGSATPSCHSNTLTTPRSGVGLRISATDTN